MTKSQAVKLVALAAAGFPTMQERDLQPTVEVWYATLRDLPYETAEAAVQKALATSRFFPTVAEIREAAASLAPSPCPAPELAWEEVLRQVREVGYYGMPQWSHPAIGRAAEMLYGGWAQLCQGLTYDSMVADRAHFLRLYGNLTERERQDALLPPAVKEIAASLADRMGRKALPGEQA